MFTPVSYYGFNYNSMYPYQYPYNYGYYNGMNNLAMPVSKANSEQTNPLQIQPATASNNIVKQQPKKKELSTGAKIAIGAGVVTALAIGYDVLACKGKHIKQIFGKGGSNKGGGNKPSSSTPTNGSNAPSTPPKTPSSTTKPSSNTGTPETTPSTPTNTQSPTSTTTNNAGQPRIGERRNPQNIHNYSLYNRTADELAQECAHFKAETGAILHVPDTMASANFGDPCSLLERAAKDGNFPKDIKHVLVGHGYGSSVRGDWSIMGRGGNVFNYINNNPQIKAGEQVLVLCCESGEKIAGRRGVGDEVILSLTDSLHPAKIVIKGENKIAGDLHFPRLLSNDSTVPSIHMYSDKPLFNIGRKTTVPSTTANFDGKSPVNVNDYTPVQQRAREFAIREGQIFSNGRPDNIYSNNVSPETIYRNAIKTKYQNIRSASYTIDGRYNPNIDTITGTSTKDILVKNQNNWNYRVGRQVGLSGKAVDRISLNVYPDEQLIAQLDSYFATGKVKGYYKTPDRMMDWALRHDPITIYLHEPVNQNIIDDIVRISKPHIRSTENVMLGKTVSAGVALDKSPTEQVLRDLINEARQYDETLAHLLETSSNAGFARNALQGDYSLQTSAGQVAAVRALLDDMAKAV